MLRCLFRRVSIASRSYLLKPSSSLPLISRSVLGNSSSVIQYPSFGVNSSWVFRNLSHGSVNLVISGGETKFASQEVAPPKKYKWKTKKKLKLQRKREKQTRKFANKRDPRRLGVKGQKRRQRFANGEERIKYKLERARIKEAQLVERLRRYEVAKLQGPVVKPHDLTGEERFYMKKMAQKRSNYVLVGRRGIFGGVILNMHLHWKKHETVKVICKPCKPGQVQQCAEEIARMSGGIPIHIIGNDTVIFYRGKDYVQPRIMSPIDTLSKKRALEKSKYEQSLESVRRFIAMAEKELELYYRHIALYGDPNDRNPIAAFEGPKKGKKELPRLTMLGKKNGTDLDFTDEDLTDIDDNFEDEISSGDESDFDDIPVHEFDDKIQE